MSEPITTPVLFDQGAVAYFFCTESHRKAFLLKGVAGDLEPQDSQDAQLEGAVCDECGLIVRPLPHLPTCCSTTVKKHCQHTAAFEGAVLECDDCHQGIIYYLTTGWRRYWKPCDLCGQPTTCERNDESQPPEGSFCQDCGNWICPDCQGGYRTDGEGARMVCARCVIHQ